MSDEHAHPFPWRLMAIVATVVVLATALAGVVLERNSVDGGVPSAVAPTASASASPGPRPLPADAGRQLTLLMQVRDEQGRAVSSVLLGVGGGTDAVSQLLLPRTLVLPTVPPMLLQDVDSPIGLVPAQEPIETLLGVNVDAVVDLERLAWIGLLDSLEGAVDPDRALQPGSFPLVLRRLVQELPNRPEDMVQLLTSLGSMAQLSVTNEDAATLLLDLRQQQRTMPTHREVLPVVRVRAGQRQASVVRQPQADEVVRDLFPEALLQPGHAGQVRVLLVRSGATAGAVAWARLALVGEGFGVVADMGGSAPAPQTRILVPGDDPEVLSRGQAVAAVLGLPASVVDVDTSPAATVDVRVELGSDAVVG